MSKWFPIEFSRSINSWTFSSKWLFFNIFSSSYFSPWIPIHFILHSCVLASQPVRVRGSFSRRFRNRNKWGRARKRKIYLKPSLRRNLRRRLIARQRFRAEKVPARNGKREKYGSGMCSRADISSPGSWKERVQLFCRLHPRDSLWERLLFALHLFPSLLLPRSCSRSSRHLIAQLPVVSIASQKLRFHSSNKQLSARLRSSRSHTPPTYHHTLSK